MRQCQVSHHLAHTGFIKSIHYIHEGSYHDSRDFIDETGLKNHPVVNVEPTHKILTAGFHP